MWLLIHAGIDAAGLQPHTPRLVHCHRDILVNAPPPPPPPTPPTPTPPPPHPHPPASEKKMMSMDWKNPIYLLKIHNTTTVYPKKYAHGFCFAVLCCGYTLTDFPISIKLASLALWQSNDCPSASKATLMNMDKCFVWIHYERLHNHNKAKHNKTVCIFLGIYCTSKQCKLQ